MTRIITEDVEDGSVDADATSGVLVVTDPVAHGTYAWRQSYGLAYWDITGIDEMYWRIYWRCTSPGSTGGAVLRFGNGTGITGRLYYTPTTKKLSFLRGSTLVTTGTALLDPDTWYLIEGYYLLAQTGGRFVIKVDGTTDIDYTGDTNAISATTINRFYCEKTFTSGYFYYDDVAVNDVNGGSDNSWIGAYSVPPVDIDPAEMNSLTSIESVSISGDLFLYPFDLNAPTTIEQGIVRIAGLRTYGPSIQSG